VLNSPRGKMKVDTGRRGDEFKTCGEPEKENSAKKHCVYENKDFADDIVERVRKVLRSKMIQINTGIYPEILQVGSPRRLSA
jgi:hypothetical protein